MIKSIVQVAIVAGVTVAQHKINRKILKAAAKEEIADKHAKTAIIGVAIVSATVAIFSGKIAGSITGAFAKPEVPNVDVFTGDNI